jgi:hypothetical protein
MQAPTSGHARVSDVFVKQVGLRGAWQRQSVFQIRPHPATGATRDEVGFQTTPQLGVAMLERALAAI